MKGISGLKPEKKIGSRPENEKPKNERFTLIGTFIDGQNAGRMAYSCKKKKSSAWLTSTEPNRSVSTFIIILIFFCRYINKTCLMFLEGTRAYETTNSPYMNEMKVIEKQPISFLHFTWDFFNAIMHNLFSLTVLFSLLGAVHKICCIGRGEGVSPKDNLLHRSYLIKKTTRGPKIADFETT